jgi:hypothetical protein
MAKSQNSLRSNSRLSAMILRPAKEIFLYARPPDAPPGKPDRCRLVGKIVITIAKRQDYHLLTEIIDSNFQRGGSWLF